MQANEMFVILGIDSVLGPRRVSRRDSTDTCETRSDFAVAATRNGSRLGEFSRSLQLLPRSRSIVRTRKRRAVQSVEERKRLHGLRNSHSDSKS